MILLILLHLINNLIWLSLDQTYLLNDAHWHFLFSFRVFDLLRQHAFPWLADISNDYFSFRWHGVFVGYLTAPFYFIFGSTQNSGVMVSSSIFLTILILSIYGVGKVLFDKRVGLLAAFLISMYPLIFNHMRVYMLDLPLASMVVLAIFLLLKSVSFTNKKYSFLFAFASGCGLLIKFNFALFILGPLAITIHSMFKKKSLRKARWNIITAILIVVLVSLGFYRLKFWEVLSRIYGCSWLHAVSFYPGYSPASILQRCLVMGKDYLLFFLRDCFNNSVSPMLFILFLFGVFINNRQTKILFTWLVFPLLVLAFFFHNPDQARYFMPVLPAMALISSAGIMALKNVKIRRLVVILVIALSCLQYFAISYRMDFLPKQIQMKIPILVSNSFLPITLFKRVLFLDFRSDQDAFSYPAKIEDKNEEILNEILSNSNNLKDKIKLFFISNNVGIYEPITYEIFVKKLPIILDHVSLSEEDKYKEQVLSDVCNILRADYVAVTKERRRNQYVPFSAERRLEELNSFFEKNIAKFELIKELNFNNGDLFLLYKKRSQNYSRISKNGLAFCFGDGIARIIYRGREITVNVGLGASFVLEGYHYSNPYLRWSSELVSPESLIIYAQTGDPPLLMRWEVDIKNNHEIGWKVSMDASSRKKVDNLCLTLFLPAVYTEWTSSLGKGSFGSRNIHAFEEIKLPDLMTKSIILLNPKEKKLPRIMFSTDNSSDVVPFVKWRNDIRAVGFYINEKNESSDRQSIFSGTIFLFQDQSDIINQSF